MKKTYIAPSIEIEKIVLNNMVAVSLEVGTGTSGEESDTKQETDWNIWSNDDEE